MGQSKTKATILRHYRLLSSARLDLVNGTVRSNYSLTTRIFPLLNLSQVLDEQMSQHLGLTDVEVFNQAMNIAHNEDVSTWVETIAQCLQEVNLQPFRSCSFRE
ncbi:MAG TPA: hypothetical protein V6C84_30065 [Coleofasciculaceae cyanobacterium]|jgi:adenylosuccinate lyase